MFCVPTINILIPLLLCVCAISLRINGPPRLHSSLSDEEFALGLITAIEQHEDDLTPALAGVVAQLRHLTSKQAQWGDKSKAEGLRRMLERHLQDITYAWETNAQTLEVLFGPFRRHSTHGIEESIHRRALNGTEAEDRGCYTQAHELFIQLYRDWTSIDLPPGYTALLQLLRYHLPPESGPREADDDGGVVLVPGAGLGRLAIEIVKQGHTVEGVDCSIVMIAAMSQILQQMAASETNHSTKLSFHPQLKVASNHRRAAARLVSRTVLTRAGSSTTRSAEYYPVLSHDELNRITLLHGSFANVQGPKCNGKYATAPNITLSSTPCRYRAIVTSFFLDTQPNIFAAVDHIYALLQPGGLWLNYGPLKYHHNAGPTPAADQLHLYAEGRGFVFQPQLYHILDQCDGNRGMDTCNSTTIHLGGPVMQYIPLGPDDALEMQYFAPELFVAVRQAE